MVVPSKSARQFSKRRVLILVLIVIFISGYSLNQFVPANSFTTTMIQIRTQTRTLLTTATIVGSNSSYPTSAMPNSASQSLTPSSTTLVTVIDNSTLTSTLLTLNNTTVTRSSTSTSTTLPPPEDIFKISQSTLRNTFNLTSSNVSFVPTSTNVPYYVITQSKSMIGLLYLTTDVNLSSCRGYESYIGTLVLVNTTGTIRALTIYSNPDSYVYMITQRWLNTYINRSVFERLQIGADAKPVTGATYSSAGVVDGVRDAGRIVVNDYQEREQNASASRSGTAFMLGAVLNIFGSAETSSSQTQSSLIALVILFGVAMTAKRRQRHLRGCWDEYLPDRGPRAPVTVSDHGISRRAGLQKVKFEASTNGSAT